jgi:hypothetical protein
MDGSPVVEVKFWAAGAPSRKTRIVFVFGAGLQAVRFDLKATGG